MKVFIGDYSIIAVSDKISKTKTLWVLRAHSESVDSSASLSGTVSAEASMVPGPVLDPASGGTPSHSVIAAALVILRSFRFLVETIGGVGSWAFFTLRMSMISMVELSQ